MALRDMINYNGFENDILSLIKGVEVSKVTSNPGEKYMYSLSCCPIQTTGNNNKFKFQLQSVLTSLMCHFLFS